MTLVSPPGGLKARRSTHSCRRRTVGGVSAICSDRDRGAARVAGDRCASLPFRDTRLLQRQLRSLREANFCPKFATLVARRAIGFALRGEPLAKVCDARSSMSNRFPLRGEPLSEVRDSRCSTSDQLRFARRTISRNRRRSRRRPRRTSSSRRRRAVPPPHPVLQFRDSVRGCRRQIIGRPSCGTPSRASATSPSSD